MNIGEMLDDEQLKVVGLIGVVVLAAAAAPMLLAPSDEPEVEPNNGTITTPETDPIQEVNTVDRDTLGTLNVVPRSHTDDSGPTVQASAGAQTMRVEATTVNGEPALNLTDERTHEGRWVSVPTQWFKQAYGEVPEVARVAHEDGGTYTETVRVRGESAAFWVRGFSTNTITFGGELVIRDTPAIDGTRHSYQLSSMDQVENVSINLTGVENTAIDSTSAVRTNGESLTANVGGTAPPRSEEVTLTGAETSSSWSGSGSGDGTVTVDGNQPAEDISATLEGSTSTSNGDQSWTGLGDGASRSLTSGNIESTGPANGEPRVTVTAAPGTVEYDPYPDNEYAASDSFLFYNNGQGTVTPGDITVPGVKDSTTSIELGVGVVNGGSDTTIDVYAIKGETADATSAEGTLVASNVQITSTGTKTIEFDSEFNGGGQTVTFGFVPEYSGSDFANLLLHTVGSGTEASSNYFHYDGQQSSYPEIRTNHVGTTDVIISTGSQSVSWSSLSEGETVSDALDIPASASSLDISTSNGQTDVTVEKTDRTATEDPALDLDGDGADEVAYNGILTSGQTSTLSASNGDLSSGSNSIDASTTAGPLPSWTIDATAVMATEDPSVTVDGQTVSHSGVLSDGETVTESVDLSTGSNTLDVSTVGEVEVAASWTEVTETRDPVVEVNGETVSYSGTLADGETVSLNANASWLREGTNNVTVYVGDGSYTGAGPEPQVGLEYRHDIESPRTVTYESEAFSERYNISKTYATERADAVLTIPHARTVISMRSLEYRLNETGTWSSVPQSASNLSGTTLTVAVSDLAGNPVPKGTTVEVRSVGSRLKPENAEISVVRATPVGFDLNSRIRLESWDSTSSLGVSSTPQGNLVHYATNESYSAESDYVELYGDGSQRFYAPNASSGSALTLNTLPARVTPERNSMRVRVPESANASNPEFVVEPASVVGDAWTAEYVAGTDGTWYAVTDDAGNQLGIAKKPAAIEVSRDDVGLVSIEATEAPSVSAPNTVGGGIFATVTTGNLPTLLVLFGSVGMLFVAGTRPARSRDAVDDIAGAVDGLISNIPRVGGPIGSGVSAAVSGVGSALVSVGENRLLTGAVAAAVAVAAAQAGLFTLGSEAGAIIAVAGIAVGSLFLLREADEFTTARWIAIVAVAGVVALQGLGETDLLSALVNSQAFLIVVLIGGYAAIQLVREYRANNSPDDDRPQVIIGGRFRSGSGDDEGSN